METTKLAMGLGGGILGGQPWGWGCRDPLSLTPPPAPPPIFRLRENSVPVDVARQRELKWLEMFNHWDKWLSRRYQKVGPAPRRGDGGTLPTPAPGPIEGLGWGVRVRCFGSGGSWGVFLPHSGFFSPR